MNRFVRYLHAALCPRSLHSRQRRVHGTASSRKLRMQPNGEFRVFRVLRGNSDFQNSLLRATEVVTHGRLQCIRLTQQRAHNGDVSRPKTIGRPFVKGQSGNPATQFTPGQSGNRRGRPKGRHAFIMRLRIAASLRKSLKLPLGATYEDVIALARTARENALQNRS